MPGESNVKTDYDAVRHPRPSVLLRSLSSRRRSSPRNTVRVSPEESWSARRLPMATKAKVRTVKHVRVCQGDVFRDVEMIEYVAERGAPSRFPRSFFHWSSFSHRTAISSKNTGSGGAVARSNLRISGSSQFSWPPFITSSTSTKVNTLLILE